jgi:serine/threonine protein kinase
LVRIGQLSDDSQSAAVARAIGGIPNRHVTGPRSVARRRRRRVLTVLLEAVDFLHSRGVIHRNISPTSILMRSRTSLEPVLSGLDHAVLFGAKKFPTARLQPAYTAPETAAGLGSPAVDWWSVGILLFDLLTGWNPFQRPDRAWRNTDGILRYLDDLFQD